MKEGLWVRDIVANRAVAGVYLAKEKKVLKGKTGKAYLLMKIGDRTGDVEARIWDRVEELGSRFQAGDLIRISGDAVSYQGALQVKIKDLRGAATLRDEHLVEFVPGYLEGREKSEKRFEALREVVRRIENDALRNLAEAFLDDEILKEGWLTAPAAKRLHHARFGGLLEHTLSVCHLVETICGHYPQLRRDLLLAGAVLHDVGKIRELSSPWSPEYTTEGRLLGHVVIGVEMLEKRLTTMPSFPEEEAMALKHIIVSHHGEFEYGSPKRPKTLEALILHMLDDLDAKYDAFHTHLTSDQGDEEGWTTYHPLLERYLYRGLPSSEASEGAD